MCRETWDVCWFFLRVLLHCMECGKELKWTCVFILCPHFLAWTPEAQSMRLSLSLTYPIRPRFPSLVAMWNQRPSLKGSVFSSISSFYFLPWDYYPSSLLLPQVSFVSQTLSNSIQPHWSLPLSPPVNWNLVLLHKDSVSLPSPVLRRAQDSPTHFMQGLSLKSGFIKGSVFPLWFFLFILLYHTACKWRASDVLPLHSCN
jgi:hypothetical protein